MPRSRSDAPVLTQRRLNRALLARQLLLERAACSIPDALHQVGGLQTQYAPSGYIGLWSRVAGLRRDDVTRALEERHAIQATLMRATIHLVAAQDYWPFAAGTRRALREWALRQAGSQVDRGGEQHAQALRAALADGPRTTADLGAMASGFVGHVGLWVDLVRVPPSGTWERRRADLLGLAETWVGPDTADEPTGLRTLLHAYLRGFGPAAPRDVASWAGVPVTWLRDIAADPTLRRFQDADGRELLDLPDAPLPEEDTPAPVRLLPHWDANLLVHARRSGLLPEPYRTIIFTSKRPFSAGVVLVDGRVVGEWSIRDGHVEPTLYEALSATDRADVDDEIGRLDAWQSA
ncbi:MAG: AlkZ family DNA glycosylase [Chloroflexi bacterium]|nr:AlkZ family DNA glycosylase [Chloroflexota bacterium]